MIRVVERYVDGLYNSNQLTFTISYEIFTNCLLSEVTNQIPSSWLNDEYSFDPISFPN